SVRRNGKSLAEIARVELGPTASIIASLAILFIVIIALAGLAFVIVKALGGEQAKLPAGMQITLPAGGQLTIKGEKLTEAHFPANCKVLYPNSPRPSGRSEAINIALPEKLDLELLRDKNGVVTLPAGCKQVIPG